MPHIAGCQASIRGAGARTADHPWEGAGVQEPKAAGDGNRPGSEGTGRGGAREAPPPLPYWIALNLQKEPA